MTNRVVLGQRANGNYGLFVSPAGVDANTAADIDLSFSSMMAHGYTVHAKGMVGPLTAGVDSTASFPALNYVPMGVIAYYDSSNQYYLYTQRELTVAGSPTTGTYTVANRTGPNAKITSSSITITGSTGQDGKYGHYVILRAPGGS